MERPRILLIDPEVVARSRCQVDILKSRLFVRSEVNIVESQALCGLVILVILVGCWYLFRSRRLYR